MAESIIADQAQWNGEVKYMRKPFLFVILLFVANSVFAGSFIVNYYIKDVGMEALKSYISSKKLAGFLIENDKNSGIVFCEGKSSGQDDKYGGSLGSSISKDLKCRVVYSLIHDSDILLVQYYRNGKRLPDYNSWPGYFEGKEPKPEYGNIDKFCSDFAVDGSVIKNILDNKQQHFFADDILAELAKVISAPTYLAYASYNYMPDLLIELKKDNARVSELQ